LCAAENAGYGTLFRRDGYADIVELEAVQFVKGRMNHVVYQYGARGGNHLAREAWCSFSINRDECSTCYPYQCIDGLWGRAIDCSNLIDLPGGENLFQNTKEAVYNGCETDGQNLGVCCLPGRNLAWA
jgi:hypothetical protein